MTPEQADHERALYEASKATVAAERARQRAEWHRQIAAANARLRADSDARDREDTAWARTLVEGETFRDGSALYHHLYAHQKQALGRSLGLSEMQRLRRIVASLWPELAAATQTAAGVA